MKIDLTDLEFDNVNVRVCIDSKLYGELNSSGIEACINANVEFEVVFEEYAQINNRLAGLLSKKLNIDAEICSSLLSDDSFIVFVITLLKMQSNIQIQILVFQLRMTVVMLGLYSKLITQDLKL